MASEENEKQAKTGIKKSGDKKGDNKQTKTTLKKTIKNPFVYIGTIIILVLTIIAFVLIPSISSGTGAGAKLPSFG